MFKIRPWSCSLTGVPTSPMGWWPFGIPCLNSYHTVIVFHLKFTILLLFLNESLIIVSESGVLSHQKTLSLVKRGALKSETNKIKRYNSFVFKPIRLRFLRDLQRLGLQMIILSLAVLLAEISTLLAKHYFNLFAHNCKYRLKWLSFYIIVFTLWIIIVWIHWSSNRVILCKCWVIRFNHYYLNL